MPATPLTPDLARSLQAAGALFEQRELRKAETACRHILRSAPRSVDALNLLALIRKNSGDSNEAETLMQRCLALDPRRADIRANLGNLYAQRGQTDAAIDAYKAALEIDDRFRAARLGLARVLLQSGNAEESLAQARELLRQQNNDVETFNTMGSALQVLQRYDEAEAAFRNALRLSPQYAIARHNLGSLLAAASRSEEALDELAAAAQAGIQGPEITQNLAATLMDLGRLDDAEALLAQALQTMPVATGLQALLARIRYMRGNANYLQTIEETLVERPGELDLQLTYSALLRGAGDYQEALAQVDALLQKHPDNLALHGERAAIQQESGDFRAAFDSLQPLLPNAAGNPGLRDLYIQACLSLGDGAAALPHIIDARRSQPLNQLYIAMQASAARLLDDPLYQYLYDYDRFVQPYTLPVPDGWSSLTEFNRDLKGVLDGRHRFSAPPLNQSLRSGTQTPRGLLGDPSPVIQAFLSALAAPLADYRQAIGHDDAHPFLSRNRGDIRLIGCWSVRLGANGFHVNHVHPEGWISSAYYVDVPDEVADTEQKCGWLKLGEPRFPQPGASAEYFVQPEAGKLVLFPSYVWHGTTRIHGSTPRLTVAFDAVPRSA